MVQSITNDEGDDVDPGDGYGDDDDGVDVDFDGDASPKRQGGMVTMVASIPPLRRP
jgi:hypothetical protein